MGSILVSPAFNPEIVLGNSNQFRNAGEETTTGNPDRLARLLAGGNTDASGYPLTDAQKQARANLAFAIQSHQTLLSDRNKIARLITDLQYICNARGTGWKKQVLDRVGNENFKGTAGNITAAIFSLGFYGIAVEVKKKKEATAHCEGVQPGGKWIKALEGFNASIIASQQLVDDAEKDVKDADDAENNRRQQEAANKQAMELAKTAPERERLKLENERIQKQREADLKELQAKNEAELAAKKDRNRTILVSSVAIAAILIGGYFLTRK